MKRGFQNHQEKYGMISKTISHYKILEKLGGGGMGLVYKAKDTKLKRTVALKFLPSELTRDPETKQRFIQEAQSASLLDHPNICTIHEIDETKDGQMFICMACYEGETLNEKIKRGSLRLDDVVNIIIQVAEGLAKAHSKGIVHRDIKPANIFITEDRQVKILDFGLAKLAGQKRITRFGTAVGTATYMSPEQARGEEVDQRTDIWSLGVVLYEMITGQLPFKGENWEAVLYSIFNEEPQQPLRNIYSDVPESLQQIVQKMLKKEIQERYKDMETLITDLKSINLKSNSITSPRVVEDKPSSSIAILPFMDMSPEKDQAYFCEGIAEELINSLTRIKGVSKVYASLLKPQLFHSKKKILIFVILAGS
jgi:non-specific serine/threonine protein kinase